MAVEQAVAEVLFEVRRKGHFTLELKVREDYFRVMYVDHSAESAEAEKSWARLVRHTAPKAYTSRFATARVVMAPAEAALAASEAAAVGESAQG